MATEAQVFSDLPIPPGELLAETLETANLTQADLARRMNRPAQAINEIVRGRKAVTAATAVGLEAALGIDARTWMNLQTQYDIVLARQKGALRVYWRNGRFIAVRISQARRATSNVIAMS